MKKILIHLPAYREPELIPTIESALSNAKHPKRLVFGICRQFKDSDKFDNVDDYRSDPRFKIIDLPHNEAKGLPYARGLINDELLDEEDYLLQLDSHHRFDKDWDNYLISLHNKLLKKSKKVIIGGYLPFYDPFDDPKARVKESWQTQVECFYPHGTCFVRPGAYPNTNSPISARYLSGHFAFSTNDWGKVIRHDPDIIFSGEELHMTIRSYTHGYDIYHLPKPVIWHATMRTERDGILVWDDFHKEGKNFDEHQSKARAKIRQLLRVEDNGFDLTGYDLGSERTVNDYQLFAGLDFKHHRIQKYTLDNQIPHNPPVSDENPWFDSFYYCINTSKDQFKLNDYNNMVIAFDDNEGEAIFRSDWDEQEIKRRFSDAGDWFSFENIFNTHIDRKPTKWVMWAHSKSKGWAERVEGTI